MLLRPQDVDAIADIAIMACTDADGFGQRSQLVRIVDDGSPDGWEFGFKDLEGEHPADTLVGFTAPDDWIGLGLVTGGWVAPMGAGLPASAHPDAVRVRILTIVSRSGHVAARMRAADGRAIDEPGEGFMLDVLRRCLGLPTPPPVTTTDDLLSALWLNEITGAAEEARRNGARRLTWGQVARLHPALTLLATGGAKPRPDALVPAARALANVLTWDRVREQACERAWLSALVSRDLARWMDDGMLSRWLLDELPPLAAQAERVSRLLRTDVAARLNDALVQLAAATSSAGR